jgi:integrase/recombinase XerC
MGIKRLWAKVKVAVRNTVRKAVGRSAKPRKKPQKRLPKKQAPELLTAPAEAALPEIQEAQKVAELGFARLPAVPVFSAIDEFSGVQLSLHTQRAYKKDLQDFFSYLRRQGIWEGWVNEVTPIVVAQFRMHLVRERKLAKGSVTRKLAVVKSFYRWARSRGWVRDNPAELIRSFPQTQESKTGFLTDQEVDELLDHVEDGFEDRLALHLARVVVETLLMLGLRRSEAAAILAGDIHYTEQRWVLRVRGKGDRDRLLPVPPRLLETWAEWLRRLSDEAPFANGFEDHPGEWLDWCRRNADQPLLVSSRSRDFRTALSTSEIARIVRKSARRAGIVNRVSPHMLRATAITHALDQGASHRGVQQMAGWTSPLMISRYDKRRKDPQFSAIHQLRYAQRKGAPATEAVKVQERQDSADKSLEGDLYESSALEP